jgi:hypothetical protein
VFQNLHNCAPALPAGTCTGVLWGADLVCMYRNTRQIPSVYDAHVLIMLRLKNCAMLDVQTKYVRARWVCSHLEGGKDDGTRDLPSRAPLFSILDGREQ